MNKKIKTLNLTPGEFFDRLTILIRKTKFEPKAYEKRLQEFIEILNQNKLDGKFIRLICELQMANTDIWNLESKIRGKEEGELGLAEVGRRAIKIRNYNTIRIDKINKLNDCFGQSKYREEKFEHLSTEKEV